MLFVNKKYYVIESKYLGTFDETSACGFFLVTSSEDLWSILSIALYVINYL